VYSALFVLENENGQKMRFSAALRPKSIFRRRDIAAKVKLAKSVALSPRTIIAHTSSDVIVNLQD
jgi:translation elongation factor EF-Tu-like GTPase